MTHNANTIALAILTSNSLDEARCKLGQMSRTKFWKLRQSTEVREAISNLSAQFYEESLAKAMNETNEHIDNLKLLAKGNFQDSQKAFVQLAASKYLLEIAHKGYELKALNERIERLEGAINVNALS